MSSSDLSDWAKSTRVGEDGPYRGGISARAQSMTCRTLSLGEQILLTAAGPELLADDLLRQHEPGVVVTGGHDVLEGAERTSKPGNSGTGSRLPVASSHTGDVPGRIRMPWLLQIGS